MGRVNDARPRFEVAAGEVEVAHGPALKDREADGSPGQEREGGDQGDYRCADPRVRAKPVDEQQPRRAHQRCRGHVDKARGGLEHGQCLALRRRDRSRVTPKAQVGHGRVCGCGSAEEGPYLRQHSQKKGISEGWKRDVKKDEKEAPSLFCLLLCNCLARESRETHRSGQGGPVVCPEAAHVLAPRVDSGTSAKHYHGQ